MRTSLILAAPLDHQWRAELTAIVGLTLSLLAAPVAGAVSSSTSELFGTATRMDGARLPHATLTLTERESGHQVVGVTDELGAFVLERVPEGTYDLVAEFPGLTPRVMTGIVIAPGATQHRVDIVFETVRITQAVRVVAPIPRDSVEVTEVRESPARDVGELLEGSAGLWNEHLSYQRDPYRTWLRVAEPGRNIFSNMSWRF